MKDDLQIQNLLFVRGYKGYEVLQCIIPTGQKILMLAYEWAAECLKMGESWIAEERCNINFRLEQIFNNANNNRSFFTSEIAAELELLLYLQVRSDEYKIRGFYLK